MAKFATILLLVVVIITAQALPLSYDEMIAVARENQQVQIQQLLRNNLAQNGADFKVQPAVFDGVRNLKPIDGGHVYGEAEYTYHAASNVGGKTTENHAGHKVINEDGKVKEFDLTPKTEIVSPVLHTMIIPSQLGNNYNAADHSLQYGPSSVGQAGDFLKPPPPVLVPSLPDDNQYVVHIPRQGGQGHQEVHSHLGGQSHQGVQSYQGAQSQQGGQSHLGGQGHQLGQSHQNSYSHQYSYSHSHSYVNGKPVEGGLLNNGGKPIIIPPQPISFTDIKDLKPTKGGQVFGEAQFQYHTSSNINGEVSEDQGGHKIINNNGHVQEFDLKPVPK